MMMIMIKIEMIYKDLSNDEAGLSLKETPRQGHHHRLDRFLDGFLVHFSGRQTERGLIKVRNKTKKI